MTIRTRLTLWYATVLTVSLLVIGFGTYTEISEQLRHDHRRAPDEHAVAEAGEMIFSSRPARCSARAARRLVAAAPGA